MSDGIEVKFEPSFFDVFAATTQGSVRTKMSKAATATMREAGLLLKTKGRAAITSGGLSQRFANSWRVDVYPSGTRHSLDPAAYGKHNAHYADIFEKGGTIHGRAGMLWIPLPTVPKVGKRIARPRDLTGVKLFKIKGTNLLAAKIRNAGANRNSRIRGQVSLPMLRAGTDAEKIKKTAKLRSKKNKGGVKASNATANAVTVPLFHGHASVTLRRRFNLHAVAEQVAETLPAIYERHAPKD